MGTIRVNGPLPGPKSKELLERWHRVEADVTGDQAPVVWDHAQGSTVTDVDGNRYIDWTSGVLVTNVGHCHPKLVEAAQRASARLLNNYECANVERVLAAERLAEALPQHLDQCFFLSTGSEAVEAALRLMKRKSGGYEILSFEGGFHGRTPGAASVGGMPGPKRRYGPVQPGILRVPYPDPYRDPCGWCDDGPDFRRYFDGIERMVLANSTGNLAGAIVEPYQGAAGFIFPPEGWLSALERWLRKHDLLYTLDEVQSSYGRTGRMWALEHEGLEPDIITIGKGIGSGVPVSAVGARSEIFACLSKGEMSSTLGGNPVGCAAVIAVLEIMREENLPERAAESGAYLGPRLAALKERCPFLGDVRGKGLVWGLEFVRDRESREPAPALIRPFISACAERGVLVGSVGMYGNVIRVAPPLTIGREDLDESLAAVADALETLRLPDSGGR